MAVEQQILMEIRELEGKTLGNRYKTINQITQHMQNSVSSVENGTEILKLFTPKDNIEKKLWVKLLSIIRDMSTFIETLNREDNELIEIMLLNSEWFFTTKKFSNNELLEAIIPNISYCNRKKLLHSLSQYLSESEVEHYFTPLRITYGLHWALMLLPSCSPRFIETVLEEENMNVPEKLLRKIYIKHSDVSIKYLRFILKNKDLCRNINDYQSILQEIALSKPKEFFELYHDSEIINLSRLGANTTKMLVVTGKHFILEKPHKYLNILHLRQLHASLNYAQYLQFYMALCPKTEGKFTDEFNHNGNVYSTLKYIKKNKLQFLLDAYKTVYQKELLENEQLITEKFMDILSAELRIKCADFMIKNKHQYPSKWEKWYCYLTPDISIPKLKEFIYIATEPNDRLRFVEYMLKCCGYSKDLVALSTVLKYLSERHRNEDTKFRQKILSIIACHFDTADFNSDIWGYIDELFRLINLDNEWESMGRNQYPKELLINRIQNKLFNKEEIQEHIEFYIKLESSRYGSDFNILQDNIEYEKTCIVKAGHLIMKVNGTVDTLRNVSSMQRTISSFNKRHPDNKITILQFEWAKSHIIKVLKKNVKHEVLSIRNELEHDPEAKEQFASIMPAKEIIISIYDLQKHIKEPKLIFEQLDKIMEEAFSFYNINTFLRFVRLRKFIYIPCLRDKIQEKSLSTFKNAEDSFVKACALKVLSHLLDTEDFYELVKSFYPEDKKIKAESHDLALYNIQKSLASSIGRYPGSEITYNALNKFCTGDFLKLTVGSLHSVCLNTNEIKSLKFLHSMLDRPVSVKKHVIRLINTIEKRISIFKLLKALWDKENNPSLRCVIITSVLNLFKQDSDNQSWELLRNIFLTLNKQDKDMLNKLLCFEDMKKVYVAEHINLCWQSIKQLETNEQLNLNGEKAAVLRRIKKHIDTLQTDFLEDLVPQSFQITNDSMVQSAFTDFVVTYVLLADPSSFEKRASEVIHVLQQYVNDNWFKTSPTSFYRCPSRCVIFEFIHELCNTTLANKNNKNVRIVFPLIIPRIFDIFNPTQIYDQYLQLNLTLIYLEANDPFEFGTKLKDRYIDVNINQFGPEVLSLLINGIQQFLHMVEEQYSSNIFMDVAKALVTRCNSKYYHICAVELLTLSEETKELYEDVVNMIKNNSNGAVQIYYNKKINE